MAETSLERVQRETRRQEARITRMILAFWRTSPSQWLPPLLSKSTPIIQRRPKEEGTC